MLAIFASIAFLLFQEDASNHANEFVKEYNKRGKECVIYTPGKRIARKKFHQKTKVENISLKTEEEINGLVEKLLCHEIVIADISTPIWSKVFDMMGESPTKKIVYYDKRENFVSPSYSSLAEEMIKVSDAILFANFNLSYENIYNGNKEEILLEEKECLGLGYNPMTLSKKIEPYMHPQRQRRILIRLRRKHNIPTNNLDKIITYTGGSGIEDHEAFKNYLISLRWIAYKQPELLENTLFILKEERKAQRNGARCAQTLQEFLQENQGEFPSTCYFINSKIPIEQIFAISNTVFYYQCESAAQFIYCKAPRLIHLDKEPKDPINAYLKIFTSGLKCDQIQGESIEDMLDDFGIDPQWRAFLPHVDFE